MDPFTNASGSSVQQTQQPERMGYNNTARIGDRGAQARPQAAAPVSTGKLTPAAQGFPMLPGVGIARGGGTKDASGFSMAGKLGARTGEAAHTKVRARAKPCAPRGWRAQRWHLLVRRSLSARYGGWSMLQRTERKVRVESFRLASSVRVRLMTAV